MPKSTPYKEKRKMKKEVTRAEREVTRDIHHIKMIWSSFLNQSRVMFSSYSEKNSQHDLDELVTRLDHEGIYFAARTLPLLAKGLLKYLETGKGAYPGFKLGRSGHPIIFKGLFRLVYRNKDIEAINMIYQISLAFSKLKGPFDSKELELHLNNFKQVDQELLHNFKEADHLILNRAKEYINSIFSGCDEDTFISLIKPRPGPGATNTPTHPSDRYRPHVIYDCIDELFPAYEWYYSNYHEFVWDIPRYKTLERRATPTSRFKFVPKTYGKPRGICIEENEVQYMQQGMKDFLYKWLESNHLTAGRINFSDQSINANLALTSSLSRTYATLDMKDASDRVSRELVYTLFSDLPYIRDALMCVSTRTITFPDEIGTEPLNTNKYAPMGSGLCFPIMSLVHYVLIRSILDLSMHSASSHDIYVYGDDIVVRSEHVAAVYDWLPRFGMKFNADKSFFRGNFRESCGIHAYNGVDITPVYFKYTPKNQRPQVVQSIISNEYDLFLKGYWVVCKELRKHININRYVHPNSSAVGWKRPPFLQYSFCGSKKRWSKSRQCVLYRTKIFKVHGDTYDFKDDAALTRWFALKANEHTGLRTEPIIKYGLAWKSQWELVS